MTRACPTPLARLFSVFLVVLLGIELAAIAVLPNANAGKRYSFNRAERCMIKKINKRRARRGKRRLDSDKQLGFVARRHARKMGRQRAIFHDNNLGRKVTHWRGLGQNVGMGGSCRSLFRAFMRSSGHRANILAKWKHVGVGAKKVNGSLFVQQVFERRRNPGNVFHFP
jgi:uncharacterized protein YkwD